MALPTATLVFAHTAYVTSPCCGERQSWNVKLTKVLPDVGDTLECLNCRESFVIAGDTLDPSV
jgi:hypothetical protein